MTTTTLEAPTGRVALADRRLDPDQRLVATVTLTGLAEEGAAEQGTVSGTACRYDVELDRGYGLMMVLVPGCFAAQVKDPARVLMLWQHDSDSPIGRLSGLTDHPDRLDYEGWLVDDPAVPTAQEALTLLRAGVIDEVSVGFRIQKYERIVDEDADTVTYRIVRAQLMELSVVTFGAFGQAAIVEEVNSADSSGVGVLEARRMRAQLARLSA